MSSWPSAAPLASETPRLDSNASISSSGLLTVRAANPAETAPFQNSETASAIPTASGSGNPNLFAYLAPRKAVAGLFLSRRMLTTCILCPLNVRTLYRMSLIVQLLVL